MRYPKFFWADQYIHWTHEEDTIMVGAEQWNLQQSLFVVRFLGKTFFKLLKFTLWNTVLHGWCFKNSYIQMKVCMAINLWELWSRFIRVWIPNLVYWSPKRPESVTIVQFFVNIWITVSYFPPWVYIFWISVEFSIFYDKIKTNISRL